MYLCLALEKGEEGKKKATGANVLRRKQTSRINPHVAITQRGRGVLSRWITDLRHRGKQTNRVIVHPATASTVPSFPRFAPFLRLLSHVYLYSL